MNFPEESKSYGFGKTWGWVNDVSIFGWTIPLSLSADLWFKVFKFRHKRLGCVYDLWEMYWNVTSVNLKKQGAVDRPVSAFSK